MEPSTDLPGAPSYELHAELRRLQYAQKDITVSYMRPVTGGVRVAESGKSLMVARIC